MNILGKMKTFLIFLVCLLELSVGSNDVPHGRSQPTQSSNSTSVGSGNLKKDLISALRRGDMGEARNLVGARALEEYLAGKNKEQRRKTLEKIYTKIRTVELLLLTGITVINNRGNDLDSPSSNKGSFEVFLVSGTDFYTRLLVNGTAVKNWGNTHVKDGRKPLHIICILPEVSPEVVKIILENGKDDINVKTESNGTPLLFASSNGNLDLVKFLVENGARVNDSATISVDTADKGEHYAYEKVFSTKEVVIPETSFHYSPLAAAIWEDNLEVVRYLISRGADVNNGGQSWGVLFNPVIYGKTEAVEVLVQSGIDVNAKDVLGSTALHKVSESGSIEIAKILLKHGADVNATDTIGWTPLHVASFFSNKAGMPLIALLIDAGSSLQARTGGGYLPLNLLVAGGNLDFMEFLVQKFDHLNATSGYRGLKEVDSEDRLARAVDLLISRGSPFNSQDDILGWSPLHWAAASGDLGVAKLLVEYGAVVSTRSKLGLNPYETAKYFGRKALADFLSTARDLVS